MYGHYWKYRQINMFGGCSHFPGLGPSRKFRLWYLRVQLTPTPLWCDREPYRLANVSPAQFTHTWQLTCVDPIGVGTFDLEIKNSIIYIYLEPPEPVKIKGWASNTRFLGKTRGLPNLHFQPIQLMHIFLLTLELWQFANRVQVSAL